MTKRSSATRTTAASGVIVPRDRRRRLVVCELCGHVWRTQAKKRPRCVACEAAERAAVEAALGRIAARGMKSSTP